jgi:hypothetical protein
LSKGVGFIQTVCCLTEYWRGVVASSEKMGISKIHNVRYGRENALTHGVRTYFPNLEAISKF